VTAALRDLQEYLDDPWLRTRTDQPHLLRDPTAERAAMHEYLDAQAPEWLQLLAHLAPAAGRLDERARLFVFAIAGDEEDLIESCLSALLGDLTSSRLAAEAELVLVCNGHGDDTPQRARHWIARHANAVRACLVEAPWPAGDRTVLARSRKLAVDLVLWRLVRGRPRGSCVFITEDADVEWVEPGRAREVVTRFERSPRMDALRGWHLRSLELLEWPLLFAERASWRCAEQELSAERLRPERRPAASFAWNRVVTAGWNVAFTLEAYVLAGGYTPDVELFEDMDLGQRIAVMRGGEDQTRGFIPRTGTVQWMPFEACSDGRRAMAALLEAADLYGQAPSLDRFLSASRLARRFPRDAARELCGGARCGTDEMEALWQRRRAELGMMVGGELAAAILARVRERLGQPQSGADLEALRTRQAAFLSAARAVRDGRRRSRELSRALLRTAA
jgi:hypothetical protein